MKIGTSDRSGNVEQVAIILIIHLSSFFLSLQLFTFLPEVSARALKFGM